MSDERRVLFLNEAFYEAFGRGDLATVEQLWSDQAAVACIHPGWAPIVGYDAVMESWAGILANSDMPEIRCREARALVTGDLALVVCYEVLDGSVLAATNIFLREAGGWKMVHHQAGPCAATPDLGPGGDDDDDEQPLQ